MKIRVPFNEDYVRLLGTAIYLFAYYEWIIIYIIERLNPGFVAEYSREKTMTSGKVLKRFEKALGKDITCDAIDRSTLKTCSNEFAGLVEKRNALIHAHPITDINGAQILNYQGKPSKAISDMKWKYGDIKELVEEMDAAACRASKILHQF